MAPSAEDMVVVVPTGIQTALARLMAGASVEVTPRDVDAVEVLRRRLPSGASVYITHLPGQPLEASLEVAVALRASGLRPVPHIAARSLRSRQELDQALRSLRGDAGVDDVLLIAGGVDPVGPFTSSLDLLREGVLVEHGITSLGVAGHPEGAPDIAESELADAIALKNAYAVETGTAVRLVTQFTFDPEPTIAWERRLRAAGSSLPIHVGLPGAAAAQTLIRFGIRCGVGPSLSVLKKQSRRLLQLASMTPQFPDATVLGVASAADADPASLFQAFHFFPFGALDRTLTWAAEVQSGQAGLDRENRLITPSRRG
ncbi:methylenetetrahydrofolate reductase [Euzebya tangerina]|uniref:methylenetetrahydrofolate reductase n=1 Tax=Euzebya tangerina TaxID=591198 RepID=UPI000E31FA6D|nr:methylenetetrahydrofolate reductase [Euzebya tangerina]